MARGWSDLGFRSGAMVGACEGLLLWSFGSFELDDEQCVLRDAGEVIALRRKVFEVLCFLVARAGRLVTKEELLVGVWPGETILEAVIPQNIAVLRRVLGDTRGHGGIIQTVHGRGYRFVAEVSARKAAQLGRVPERGPMVGRERVLGDLRALLEAACAGAGQIVLLQGEAGIGKTRVIEEVAREARQRGVLVLEGHCHDVAGAPSYRPWLSAISPLVDASARASSGDLAGLLGLQLAPPAHAGLEATAEARFKLFDRVLAELARACRRRPVMLVLEDLHWADQASLQLLSFVSRELRALPLLLLASMRAPDSSIPAATQALIAQWSVDGQVRRIPLAGLPAEDVAELVTGALARACTPELLRAVHALTAGNPLHLHELVHLYEAEPAQAELPRRLRDVVELRVQRLGPVAQRALPLAAAIGQRFPLAALETVAGVPRPQLFDALARACEAHVLRQHAPEAGRAGTYEFSHALLQEALYESLPAAQRPELHARVGRALEAVFGAESEAHLDELAHHFRCAAVSGDVARAVMYSRRAADAAYASLAFERAAEQYRAALDVLALALPIDETQRFELKLGLGMALFRAGEDGTSELLAAAAIARKLEQSELSARVVFALEGWPRLRRRGRTDNPALYPLLRETLDRLPPSDTKVQLMCTLALNVPEQTPLPEQVELSRRALELAYRRPSDAVLYHALVARVLLLVGPNDLRQRLDLTRELQAIARRSEEPERRFYAHELAVQPLLALGHLEDADRELEQCAELAERLELPRFTLQVLRFRLQRALADGRFDEVRALTKQAVAVRGKAVTSPNYLVSLYTWQSFERAWHGDRAWFECYTRALLPKIEQARLLRAHLAAVCASFGKYDEARRCYAPLVQPKALAGQHDEDWLMMQVFCADAVAACEDRAAARTLYQSLAPYAAHNVAHLEWRMYFGACAHWLGMLAALLGEHARAAQHFEDALSFNVRLGARPAVAQTCLEYAKCLRRQHGASAQAAALAQRAARLAAELGLEPLRAQAHHLALLTRTGTNTMALRPQRARRPGRGNRIRL